ncbi:MAG: 50S ribosomal protein L17 [Patescibacteria group bacterium]
MRHLKKGRKFGRVAKQRRALMKSLASSFAVSGQMQTTEAKARELRPLVEKFLTRAKTPTLANRRLLMEFFSPEDAGRMIALAVETGGRPGGYTRIVKTGFRRRDSAKMAILELVK